MLDPEKISMILTNLTPHQSGSRMMAADESVSEESLPIIWHYIQEITRQRNRLNYVRQKVQRGIKIQLNIASELLSLVIYQIQNEKIPLEEILAELRAFFESQTLKTPPMKDLRYFLKRVMSFSWDRALQEKSSSEKLSLELAIPSFTLNHLSSVMTEKDLRANLLAMDNLADSSLVSVRFNHLGLSNSEKSGQEESRSSILREVETQLGIKLVADSHLPDLYLLPRQQKQIFKQSQWYQRGLFIFQDKASLIPPLLLHPQADELIGDLCAAPGIKTSYLSQLSLNQARIIASDVHVLRSFSMKSLFAQLHVQNVLTLLVDSIHYPTRYSNLFDKILLDAPCTGSGTFGSNPELKWHQNSEFLHRNQILQEKLLNAAYTLLKPGGELVYSTCSLYPEEGEAQIAKISNIYETLPILDWISPSYKIDNELLQGTGRLFPALHHTQGFFFAYLRKL